MTRSERNRRYRERKRGERAVLKVEVNLGQLADLLVDGGHLAAWDSEDRKMIEAAFQTFVDGLRVYEMPQHGKTRHPF